MSVLLSLCRCHVSEQCLRWTFLWVFLFAIPLFLAIMSERKFEDENRRGPYGVIDTTKLIIPLRSEFDGTLTYDMSFINKFEDTYSYPVEWGIKRIKIPRLGADDYNIEGGLNNAIYWSEQLNADPETDLVAAITPGSYNMTDLAAEVGLRMTQISAALGNIVTYEATISGSTGLMTITASLVVNVQWRLKWVGHTNDAAKLLGFDHINYTMQPTGGYVLGSFPTFGTIKKSYLIASTTLKSMTRDLVLWNGKQTYPIVHIFNRPMKGYREYTNEWFQWVEELYDTPVFHSCKDGIEFNSIDISILTDDLIPAVINPNGSPGTGIGMEVDLEFHFKGSKRQRRNEQ